jgi:hypothetical protein
VNRKKAITCLSHNKQCRQTRIVFANIKGNLTRDFSASSFFTNKFLHGPDFPIGATFNF